MDDIGELYYLFPELKDNIVVEKKVGQGCKIFEKRNLSEDQKFIGNFLKFLGTFSYVYSAHFLKKTDEKVALKYIIPTSSPSRTKQEIECLMNIGFV